MEVSNLNRQILYCEDDIGLPKVDVAARRLRAFNSQIKITTTCEQLSGPEDIASFVEGSDIVVDTADWPPHDFDTWCNIACFGSGIPYITMSHFPPIARVGPLFIPGTTGCHACQEISMRREYPRFDMALEQSRARPRPAATLGAACGLIGGQVGVEVMHLLTGLRVPSTVGAARIYDLRTMEVTHEPVIREPSCPVCSHL